MSSADWLPVYWDQLWAQHLVTSMGQLYVTFIPYLYLVTYYVTMQCKKETWIPRSTRSSSWGSQTSCSCSLYNAVGHCHLYLGCTKHKQCNSHYSTVTTPVNGRLDRIWHSYIRFPTLVTHYLFQTVQHWQAQAMTSRSCYLQLHSVAVIRLIWYL